VQCDAIMDVITDEEPLN